MEPAFHSTPSPSPHRLLNLHTNKSGKIASEPQQRSEIRRHCEGVVDDTPEPDSQGYKGRPSPPSIYPEVSYDKGVGVPLTPPFLRRFLFCIFSSNKSLSKIINLCTPPMVGEIS